MAWSTLTVGLLGLVGCPGIAGPAGVTPGGAQDIASARKVIEDGGVPDPDAITVQGFISEHSIGIDVPLNAGLLFDTVTTAWNQDFDEIAPLATLVLGFGTTVDRNNFDRRPQNLALVIDRSGSMDDPIDERSGTSKLQAIKIAIDRLLGQLDANDRVSVVSFSDKPRVDLKPVPGNDIISIKTALDGIAAKGSTDLAAGMTQGYQLVQDNSSPDRADRILVFTDARPTRGLSESKDFIKVMDRFASMDIGATIFGVGVNFGEELAFDISQIRGGNFFFLNDLDRIVTVFDEEFKFLVTPIANDVSLVASIPFVLDVQDVHGLPQKGELTHTIEMTIPTLFLSSQQGGGSIFVRLRLGSLIDFSQPIDLGTVRFSFATPEGATVTTTNRITLPAGLDPAAAQSFFENDAAKRAVLLLNTALVLKNASDDAFRRSSHFLRVSDADLLRAATRISEFLPYFDAMAQDLPDSLDGSSRSLSQERALLEKLLANIQSRM